MSTALQLLTNAPFRALLAILMVFHINLAYGIDESTENRCSKTQKDKFEIDVKEDGLRALCLNSDDGEKDTSLIALISKNVGLSALDEAGIEADDPSTYISAVGLIGQGGNGNKGQDVFLKVRSNGEQQRNINVGFTPFTYGILAKSFGAAGQSGGCFFSCSDGTPGSDAGDVTLDVDNVKVTTKGEKGSGIIAKSFGGKGGSGGGGYFSSATGASGGAGGAVRIKVGSLTEIRTAGDYAFGIEAISRGAIGGNGGSSIFANGDEGGVGSSSFGVQVSNAGEIKTGFDPAGKSPISTGAAGIVAQSIGGGGGNGGDGGFFGSSSEGGAGANGGIVIVRNQSAGRIITFGKSAPGIIAQSIGGGGGNGGSSVGPLALGVGKGGRGGSADSVVVTNVGSITTQRKLSPGIFAQSIGGGGGQGGSSRGIVSLGAAGGSGNTASTVLVRNNEAGQIHTHGTSSSAIFAQSIGGGGGNAGSAIGAVALGGSGGEGGSSKAVVVYNAGSLVTELAESSGIFAQSIGGGGGNGGSTAGILSLGGSGGKGAFGSDVVVWHSGQIKTSTRSSSGIYAQSIGGGGGSGGSSFGWDSLGGTGSSAGKAGAVKINITGKVETKGANSHGIFAQSVGGGGGDGGDSVAAGIGEAVAIGGRGGSGGDGGQVVIDRKTIRSQDALVDGKPGKGVSSNLQSINSKIATNGNHSAGIFAQSVGGGGGSGGSALAASVGEFAGAVAIGGSGNAGGDGNSVTIDNPATIETNGYKSWGILGQSVGGGGGAGGFSLAASGGASGAISVSLGGQGGGGGDASKVTVINHGDIVTSGKESAAMYIQSIGGGGGSGGFSIAVSASGSGSAAIGFGGTGGGGGDANNVKVTNNGELITKSRVSNGITAQSVGGGGGDGGFNISGSVASPGPVTLTGAVTLGAGGFGGDGGNGAFVDVNNKSLIETSARDSLGVLAQSIGGGGGNGGFNISASFSGNGSLSAGLGGFAGGGGFSKEASIDNSGIIRTNGRNSNALLAQSIGGGGGNGGFNISASLSSKGALAAGLGGFGGDGGASGLANITNRARVVTSQDQSNAVTSQSIGGGGGNGGFNVSAALSSNSAALGVGGFGGKGGVSEKATINNSGKILTKGDDSKALFAQSIGGGGGNGGFNISANISANNGLSAGVGGFGKSGGDSSKVVVENNGELKSSGERSNGLTAQSIGGGGGNGGFNVSGNLSGGKSATLGIGGFGAGGGKSGGVKVVNSGAISTSALESNAILAQSVGGGGGNGGFNISGNISKSDSVTAGVGGFGAGGGEAGAVTLDNEGDLSSNGSKSNGLTAQSIGGGGGNGGFNVSGNLSGGKSATLGVGGFGASGGKSGRVKVKNSGAITTNALESNAILAQSIGGGGGNGGFNISGNISKSDSVTAGVGGFSGKGGEAGLVTLVNKGDLSTNGGKSNGLTAQSIGGGGGNGGFNISGNIASGKSLNVGVGGFGASGGGASEVDVSNSGNITTDNKKSYGILVQSLGGGGGNGGFNISGSLTSDKGVTVGVGGFAGNGGVGKKATLSNSGAVVTKANDSAAVLVQSIGGGGGNGGFNITGAINHKSNGLTAGIGGGAGSGNISRVVSLNNSGKIETSGNRSGALIAQSVGGGGGNGGFSVSGAALGKNNANFSVGGNGGEGSVSGIVTVRNESSLATKGDYSNAITAQSIGGGGGDGGFSLAATKSNKAATFAIGGSADKGGNSRSVSVFNKGKLATANFKSSGISAQSIGGGGGNGGGVVDITFVKENNLNVGVGGKGGTGGSAGAVQVNNKAAIKTNGYQSYGVQAQSVGGGGGNGGFAVAVTGIGGSESKDKKQNSLSVSIGGSGGSGGKSIATLDDEENKSVTVLITNAGQIDTSGLDSHGLFAQSIGGGGGVGGMASVISLEKKNKEDGESTSVVLALGGRGGEGNDAGKVKLNNKGDVRTNSDHSNGIFAQSIGGGGGSGGASSAVVFDEKPNRVQDFLKESGLKDALADPEKKEKKPNDPQIYNLTIGGSGGGSGDGDVVSVSNEANISTKGFDSVAIMAQSIGGGGGSGGASMDASFVEEPVETINDASREAGVSIFISSIKPSSGSEDHTIAVGGSGGNSGHGRRVLVSHTGNLSTKGDQSVGIFAQSVGGGGGRGTVASEAEGKSFLLGGSGGAAGDGGHVIVKASAGSITTAGDYSHGIFAQSIGGGGGVSGGVTTEVREFEEDQFSTNLGGGSSGNGGDIDIVNKTVINTAGHGAHGVLAQTIGGGGGIAGALIIGDKKDTLLPTNESLFTEGNCLVGCGLFHGSNGGNGSSGLVSIDHSGRIVTNGQSAFGIFAQSQGGSLDTLLELTVLRLAFPKLELSDNDPTRWSKEDREKLGGKAFDITKRSTWSKDAKKAYDDTIESTDGLTTKLADIVDVADDITVKISGSIEAKGKGSIGVYANSVGADGNGDITINVQKMGVVTGGKRTFELAEQYPAAIYIEDGESNLIVNRGVISTSDGVVGLAIHGGDGNEEIVNFGVLSGSVRLGKGINSIVNKKGAIFNSGRVINLGEGNVFTNQGTLIVGGKELAAQTVLKGDFVQTELGRLRLDVNLKNAKASHLVFKGSADLAGTIVVKPLKRQRAKLGGGQVTLLTGERGIVNSGIELEVPNSPVVTYALTFPSENEVGLDYHVDFNFDEEMVSNTRAVADHLNQLLQSLSSETLTDTNTNNGVSVNASVDDGVFAAAAAESTDDLLVDVIIDALLDDVSSDELIGFYSDLTPLALNMTNSAQQASNQTMVGDMLSCRSYDGAHRFTRESDCSWLKVRTVSVDRENSANHSGYSSTVNSISGGAQIELYDDMFVGLSALYGRSNMAISNNRQSSIGKSLHLGVIAKRQFGGDTLSLAMSLGKNQHDTKRELNIVNLRAEGEYDTTSVSLHARYAKLFEFENSYLKPILDIGYSYSSSENYSESGAGPLNLVIDGESGSFTRAQLLLEYGQEFDWIKDKIVRFYATAGGTWDLTSSGHVIESRFQGVGSNAESFSTEIEADGFIGQLNIGLDIISESNLVLRFSYEGRKSSHTQSHGGSIKLSYAL